MKYIVLKSGKSGPIRFELYKKEAPRTCEAFVKSLPIKTRAVHAKISGEEIWMPEGPRLKVPQENATVRLKIGELGYAAFLKRSDISHGIALVYGKVNLWDCVNVFAGVVKRDVEKLKKLAREIKMKGSVTLRFELL